MSAVNELSPTETASRIYSSDVAEVWRGNCLDAAQVDVVMGKRKADLLCFDAPYSSKTHSGHRNGKLTADRAAKFAARPPGQRSDSRANSIHKRNYAARKAARGESGRRDIDYASWSTADVRRFCDLWCPRTTGWIVTITDDVLAPAWRTSLIRHGRYPFAPLPLVETGSRVRMTGDGPSGWTCWLVVARPRGEPWSSWGTLRGAYVVPGERDMNSINGTDRIVGGKSLLAMQCIVEDYSRRGDLVVDATSGGGTTLRAALAQGRRALGIESDEGRAALSAKACASVNIGQRDMFEQGVGS